MIPVAPARFSTGINSRSIFSSKITSAATHAESARRLIEAIDDDLADAMQRLQSFTGVARGPVMHQQ